MKEISQKVSVGDQPRETDLERLKKEGVATVVNFRLAAEESPLNPAEERAIAEKLGLFSTTTFRYHSTNSMPIRSKSYGKFSGMVGTDFVHCGIGQRACSLSLTASGVRTDPIFEQARELGFPVQDEKLRTFLKSLRE